MTTILMTSVLAAIIVASVAVEWHSARKDPGRRVVREVERWRRLRSKIRMP